MDLSLFEKVELTNGRKGETATITMHKKGYRTVISSDICQKAGLTDNDRIDLYKMGQTYALRKASAGCVKFNKVGGGGGHSLMICNQGLWLNTCPHAKDIEKYDAWVEEGVIFFKKKAEQ